MLVSNDFPLERERVVSSSTCAFTPLATTLKNPLSIKFLALKPKEEPFTLKTPSVISIVPVVEQFLQLTLMLSSTDPSLYPGIRIIAKILHE
jgi:hypothetical protein